MEQTKTLPHDHTETPRVRVLSPWDSYKDWKAGRTSLLQLLAIIAENAAGAATVMHFLGYENEAQHYKEQAESAVALFRQREAGALDDTHLVNIEALIDGYLPTIQVLPPRRTQYRVHRPYPQSPLTTYRSTIDLQVNEGASGTYCVQAEQDGSRPRARAAIWSIYRVKERSWYDGEQLEILEKGLTRMAAGPHRRVLHRDAGFAREEGCPNPRGPHPKGCARRNLHADTLFRSQETVRGNRWNRTHTWLSHRVARPLTAACVSRSQYTRVKRPSPSPGESIAKRRTRFPTTIGERAHSFGEKYI